MTACFTAISFLCCCYGQKIGPLCTKMSQTALQTLNKRLIEIFQNKDHHQLYTAALTAYGLYGLPKRESASRICYDSGVFKAAASVFIARHGSESKDIVKLKPSDVVFIRLFSNVVQTADTRLREYSQTR